MPSKNSRAKGVLNALLPGARLDKNTQKISVHAGVWTQTVIFNIGGTKFETYRSTLTGVPTSKLNNDDFLRKYYREDKRDYFFDRDPKIFHCILNYLRSGELHLPTSVCGPVVKSELEFWGLDEVDIEECCWSRYSNWVQTLYSLRKLNQDKEYYRRIMIFPKSASSSLYTNIRKAVWKFLVFPTSCVPAHIYAYFSLFVMTVSIFSFCAQTHSFFQDPEPIQKVEANISSINHTQPYSVEQKIPYHTEKSAPFVKHPRPHQALYYIDVACAIFFIVEIILKIFVAPHRCKMLTIPMTLIDIIALLPDLVDWVLVLTNNRDMREFLAFLKFFRVFRVFRLMRHIPGLWVLFYTLKASMKDLLLLLMFLVVGMLVFASLAFYAEHGPGSQFDSIPKCFWWAVITMTTVGYGDMSPVTGWGYLVGTATSIVGVLMIGFTVPVLVNNFILYYNHTQSTINREKRRQVSSSDKNAVIENGWVVNKKGEGVAHMKVINGCSSVVDSNDNVKVSITSNETELKPTDETSRL